MTATIAKKKIERGERPTLPSVRRGLRSSARRSRENTLRSANVCLARPLHPPAAASLRLLRRTGSQRALPIRETHPAGAVHEATKTVNLLPPHTRPLGIWHRSLETCLILPTAQSPGTTARSRVCQKRKRPFALPGAPTAVVEEASALLPEAGGRLPDSPSRRSLRRSLCHHQQSRKRVMVSPCSVRTRTICQP